jgi:nitrile hydratase subunit alpha
MATTRHSHDHQVVPSDPVLRVKSMESLLVEKGFVDRAALDALVDTYEHKIGPRNGARVVAKAWVDYAYKQRLLNDATAAIAELGFRGEQGEHMVVVENTPTVHNLIVCTLCSCYPWPVLGLPPVWYKSAPYRSRSVIDPRGVVREFGLELPDDVEVRVWDSTAELRYLVLPERPAGSENLSEEALAALVTRDAMIGVARVTLSQGGARVNGVHDMGGMHGMGPIEPQKNEPVFHARWEARIFALRRAMRPWNKWNGNSSRHQIELIPAAEQLRLSYYAKQVEAFHELIAKSGLVTPAELASGKRARGSPKAVPLLKADEVPAFVAKGAPASRQVAVTSRFQAGQSVRARNINPVAHTRLPRYARGKTGTIESGSRRLHFSGYQRSRIGREASARLRGSVCRARVMG